MPSDARQHDHEQPGQQPIGTSPRVRDQPALTTSSGRIWLIMAALFAAFSFVALVPMLALEPQAVSAFGIVAIVVLYAGVVLARVLIPEGRRRLGVMAGCMLAMAAVALTCVIIVAANQ